MARDEIYPQARRLKESGKDQTFDARIRCIWKVILVKCFANVQNSCRCWSFRFHSIASIWEHDCVSMTLGCRYISFPQDLFEGPFLKWPSVANVLPWSKFSVCPVFSGTSELLAGWLFAVSSTCFELPQYVKVGTNVGWNLKQPHGAQRLAIEVVLWEIEPVINCRTVQRDNTDQRRNLWLCLVCNARFQHVPTNGLKD